jgi:hypothetical protein
MWALALEMLSWPLSSWWLYLFSLFISCWKDKILVLTERHLLWASQPGASICTQLPLGLNGGAHPPLTCTMACLMGPSSFANPQTLLEDEGNWLLWGKWRGLGVDPLCLNAVSSLEDCVQWSCVSPWPFSGRHQNEASSFPLLGWSCQKTYLLCLSPHTWIFGEGQLLGAPQED